VSSSIGLPWGVRGRPFFPGEMALLGEFDRQRKNAWASQGSAKTG
jgi:hypothetical protein